MSFLDKIFPPGKMQLTLEKYSYSPGETIKGKAVLTTKKPVHATEFKIRLYAEQITQERNVRGEMETVRTRVYDYEQPLDGEKDYTDCSYDFEIKIPGKQQEANELLKKGMQAAKAFSGVLNSFGVSTSLIEWRVRAELNIPGGRDIKKQTSITIN